MNKHAEQSALVAELMSARQVPEGAERVSRQAAFKEIVNNSKRNKQAKPEPSPVSESVLQCSYGL